MADAADDDDVADDKDTVNDDTNQDNGQTDDQDDSQDDDQTDDQDDAGDDQDDSPAPSRASGRISRLSNDLQREREARIRAEAERDSARNSRSGGDAEAARRQRAEQLALMTPEERRIAELEERIERSEQQTRSSQLIQQGMTDRQSYEILCSRNTSEGRLAEKYKDEVERMHQDAFKNGTFVPRDSFLSYLIGQNARKDAGKNMKQKTAAKAAAKTRVEQSKGTPTSAKGDAGKGGAKGDDLATHWDRLMERRRTGATE